MYANLYLFPFTRAPTEDPCVPHLLEQNPSTATSAEVRTMLIAFLCGPLDASFVVFVGGFPPRGNGWLGGDGFGRGERGDEISNDGFLRRFEFTVPNEVY